jgi:RimJ/RimL family protein N-acetyltransferase
MKDQFIIEKARAEDAPKIIDFLNKIGGETDFLTFGLNDISISTQEEIEIINECLHNDTSLMLVAKMNDNIVAQLFLEVSTRVRLMHIGHLGISVSQSHWGKSIASRMLSEAIQWAKEKGLIKIQLQVRTDNESAINLYKKFNFSIEGIITNALKIDNILYDDFVMGLTLI